MSSKYLNLDTSVQYIKGIGPKRAEILEEVNIEDTEDLITYFPRKYLDRSNLVKINSLKKDQQVTVTGKVLSREKVMGRKKRFIVMVGDGTGILQCVWFQGIHYIQNVFKVGEIIAFSGKVTYYRGPQLIHPEYDKISEQGETDPLHTGCIVPLYPSTEKLRRKGFDSRGFRRVIQQAIQNLEGKISETLSQSIIKKYSLMSYTEAIHNIHFPENWHELQKARKRLKFEELFYIQLYLALQRKKVRISGQGIEFTRVGELTSQLVDRLPFELTEAQKRVTREIRQDMKSREQMSRLLQGDVGSGKTIVSLIAMLIAVENGYQAALMAPTEILAEQHYITVHSLLENLGVKVELFKGSKKSSFKKDALERLSQGDINIAVGTHALVQKGVEFDNLGFAVIDEQHRFGVMQRAVLGRKGNNPDVLVMTATPIPRTLALTLYGDLDISVLNEMPQGRLPIRTIWRREDKKPVIYEYIRDEVKKGKQVYIVYPLVEESKKLDLQAATNGYCELSEEVFQEFTVGLLHGRMKGEEKEKVMQDFKAGDIQILVSTTVIEVGIDVKNATVMLIEHAERFGLTQLHQLRGRVGRGKQKSMCILLTYGYLTDTAMKRIDVMTKTNDGFKIAEEDLQIRGPGELFGTRQHGALNLKIANLMTDQHLLEPARQEAFALVEEDHTLSRQESTVIKQTYQKRYKGKYDLIRVG
ncbi:MAG: ATP-dependent DNA helicase RecG [bacterium]